MISVPVQNLTKCKRKLLIADVVAKIPNIQRPIDNEKYLGLLLLFCDVGINGGLHTGNSLRKYFTVKNGASTPVAMNSINAIRLFIECQPYCSMDENISALIM